MIPSLLKAFFLLFVLNLTSISCRTNSAELDQFSSEALKAHNEYRQQHGVSPLILNQQLADLAQQTAEKSARSNRLVQDRPSYRGTNPGAMYAMVDGMSTYTGRQTTDLWYRSTSRGIPTKNQLIWKSTQMVGFGGAVSATGKVYIVAYYYPPGNVLGQERQNVFPRGGPTQKPVSAQSNRPSQTSFSFTTASSTYKQQSKRPTQKSFTFTTSPVSPIRPVKPLQSSSSYIVNSKPQVPKPSQTWNKYSPQKPAIPSSNEFLDTLINQLQQYKTQPTARPW